MELQPSLAGKHKVTVISQDYEEFIVVLNEFQVRYLIVGAHALAVHVRPRATNDLDVLVQPTIENATRVAAAVDNFVGVKTEYTVSDFCTPYSVVQIGVEPVRIDVLTQLTGAEDFEELWRNRVDANFGATLAHFIGIDGLILTKKACGRPIDLIDVDLLLKRKAQT